MFGALAVVIAEPILPYALAFAAGAMIYVVVDDIIPEAQTWYVFSAVLYLQITASLVQSP
jgi:zinc transporter ZupT